MKQLFCTLLLLSAAVQYGFAPSKHASVKWGPELEGSSRGSIESVIGFDESGYYLLGYQKSDVIIRKINRSMNDVATYVFLPKDKAMDMKFTFETARYFNDKLYVYKSYIDKESKKKILYYERLNKKTLQADGKSVKLAEIDYEKKSDAGAYSVRVSADESKILVVSMLPDEKGENERNQVMVLDSTMKVVWKKVLSLPYQDKLFIVQDWECDDEGNVFSLGKLYNGKLKDVVRGKQNYAYHMVAYTKQGEQKIDYNIELKDNFITDLTFSIGNDGMVTGSGFYSKKNKSSIDGAFYMVLDIQTKKTKFSSMKEFDTDFLTMGLTEKEEEKIKRKEEKGKDMEMPNFDLHDLVRRDDGGTLLIGEQYYTTQVMHTSNGRTYYTTYYHYNDIIVVSIDPKGNIAWTQKIPKRQVSSSDGGFYSSFAMAVNKSNLYFVFNDHKDNLAPKKKGGWKNFDLRDKNGIVAIATISEDGTLTREALFSDDVTEVSIRPKVSDQVEDNTLLLFGERKKTDQFALITLK